MSFLCIKRRLAFFISIYLYAVIALAATLVHGQTSSLLAALSSPILLKGNSHTAYRDALLIYRRGSFYLFYSYVKEDAKTHLIYWFVGMSMSRDLQHWSPTRILTPKNQNLNYSSPGSLTRYGDEWILTVQTYPIPNFRRGDPLRYGDNRCRIFIMKSRDLRRWSNPELIRVKGPDVNERDMGSMIDPFLLQDKEDPGKWLCFYKQHGEITYSYSRDLKNWTPTGIDVAHGENPDVLVVGNEYLLVYSPANGIQILRSHDLIHWQNYEPRITLGQKHWPWAEARLTAGYIADMRNVPGIGKYVLVCHSMGPGNVKTDANVQANCNIVIAWSDDLKTWNWPGKRG